MVIDSINKKTVEDFDTLMPIDLFDQIVDQYPNQTAVVCNNESITYKNLKSHSKKIANALVEHDSSYHSDFVGLFVNRSTNMVKAILGTLRSGKVYLPLDVGAPFDRIKYIIKNSGAKIILTTDEYKELLSSIIDDKYNNIKILSIDSIIVGSKSNLKNSDYYLKNNNAYLIYTSGTTGEPKGVIIKNSGVVNLAVNLAKEFGLRNGNKKNCLQFSNFVFDSHVAEVFTCILNGHTLYIIADEIKTNLSELTNYIDKYKINIATIPPTMLVLGTFFNLELLVVAAERASPSVIREYISRGVHVINAYGPTETTVCATVAHNIRNTSIVGKAIKNFSIHILDDQMLEVKKNIMGEVCIASKVALADGYLKKPSQTKDNFIYSHKLGQMLFRTGDLGFIDNNGNLHLHGRRDDQINLNGHRVELGEIRSVLNSSDLADQVIVTQKKINESKYIVAYYLIANPEQENILHWQKTLDLVNNKNSKTLDKYAGWVSSYDNKPLSQDEMDDYFHNIAETLIAYGPKVVFDIGCGEGILMDKLGKYFKSYTGIDFSKSAILQCQNLASNKGYSDKVRLITGSTNEINWKEFGSNNDLVIMNSIIQYFPSIEYTTDFLKNVFQRLLKHGTVYIGDVRNFQLQKVFYNSLLRNSSNTQSINLEIEKLISIEQELLISPVYFYELSQKIDDLDAIEIRPKCNKYINELTKYRYDVIFHKLDVNSNIFVNNVMYEDFKFVQNITEYLEKNFGTSEKLFVRYPNAILVQDINDCSALMNDFIEQKENYKNNLMRTDEIKTVGLNCGYNSQFYIDISNPGCLLIIFDSSKRSNINNIVYKSLKFACEAGHANEIQRPCINDESTINALREYASSKLPSYMVPSFFKRISKIPLNASGKIDYNRLPDIDFNENLKESDYDVEEDTIEDILLDIWYDTLKIDRKKLDRNASFFKIGGNSILAIKLLNHINKRLHTNLSIANIYDNSTVTKLNKHIRLKKVEESKSEKIELEYEI